MLSKNNFQERVRKMEPKKDRFSIRKFTIGAVSVLIGSVFFAVGGQQAQADVTVPVNSSDNSSESATSHEAGAQDTVETGSASKLVVNAGSVKNAKVQARKANKVSADSNRQSERQDITARTIIPNKNMRVVVNNRKKVNKSEKAGKSSALKKKKQTNLFKLDTIGPNDVISTDQLKANKAVIKSDEDSELKATIDSKPQVTFEDVKKKYADFEKNSASMSDEEREQAGAELAKMMDQLSPADQLKLAQINTISNGQIINSFSDFIAALRDPSVHEVTLGSDIKAGVVDGVTGSGAFNKPRYKGMLTLGGKNIAHQITINGAGHEIDFGKYHLEFENNNQGSSNNTWDITFKDIHINADTVENKSVEAGWYSPLYFGNVKADNQKKITVIFDNVTANVTDRPLIAGATNDHSSQWYTVILKGNNTIVNNQYIKNVSLGGNSGSAIDAGYVDVVSGTTNIFVTRANDGNQNYGANAIRTSQPGGDREHPYTLDIKEGATLNIGGGSNDPFKIKSSADMTAAGDNAAGIYANDLLHGTVHIAGTYRANMGKGSSQALMAGNLIIDSTGTVDITTQQDNNGASNIDTSSFEAGHYAPIAIGVGQPGTTGTRVDAQLVDNGSITINRITTNETNTGLIAFGVGSGDGSNTMTVGQNATLDLRDASASDNTGNSAANNDYSVGMISMYNKGAKAVLNFNNPKYVNLERTGTQAGGFLRLEGLNNHVYINNQDMMATPVTVPVAQWDK